MIKSQNLFQHETPAMQETVTFTRKAMCPMETQAGLPQVIAVVTIQVTRVAVTLQVTLVAVTPQVTLVTITLQVTQVTVSQQITLLLRLEPILTTSIMISARTFQFQITAATARITNTLQRTTLVLITTPTANSLTSTPTQTISEEVIIFKPLITTDNQQQPQKPFTTRLMEESQYPQSTKATSATSTINSKTST